MVLSRVKEDKRYKVSTTGVVVGPRAVLSPKVGKTGYLSVNLAGVGMRYVHRLVALAFIPNPDGKPQVNHKNGNKADNRVCNLEWATHAENTAHAVQSKLYKSGEAHGLTTLTPEQVAWVREDTTVSMRAKAQQLGVSVQTISNIWHGRTWRQAA